MTPQEIEHEVQHILDTETSAAALSANVFGHDGLFAKLANTNEERKQLVKSRLYQNALERFHELQSKEMAAFGRKVAELRAEGVGAETAVRFERVRTT